MNFPNNISHKISLFWSKFKLKTDLLNQIQVHQEARTRILLWYLTLICLFVFIAIPTIKYRLITELNQRVKADMREDLEEFEEELIETLLELKIKPELQQTESEIANQDIYYAFDKFISTHKAEDDNYFITIVDGQFYKSNVFYLPKIINRHSHVMQHWQQITEEERGEIKIDDPKIGSVLYKAEPIKTPEKVIGVFVVAHLTAGERQEVSNSLNIVIQVLIFMLSIALLLAWWSAGKVLAPLRNFSKTAKSISESDLSQRIQIRGNGELAQLGHTFNAMMDRIETAFGTQRNFLNDAGHELKTPITIIRGHLELMETNSPSQQETIDLVIDELDRMNRLVEELLVLAKAERPDFLQIETIELTSFIPELFSKIRTLGERNWHLDNAIFSGTITGDRQRITQAIINLANNAVQHTIIDSLIIFGAKIKSDRVEFWIRDTGDGIATDEQKRIFDRFTRVKNSRRRSEGSGLGLAIVKAVVEAHGGAINLQSKLGIGSTFTLVFPLQFNAKKKINP